MPWILPGIWMEGNCLAHLKFVTMAVVGQNNGDTFTRESRQMASPSYLPPTPQANRRFSVELPEDVGDLPPVENLPSLQDTDPHKLRYFFLIVLAASSSDALFLEHICVIERKILYEG